MAAAFGRPCHDWRDRSIRFVLLIGAVRNGSRDQVRRNNRGAVDQPQAMVAAHRVPIIWIEWLKCIVAVFVVPRGL